MATYTLTGEGMQVLLQFLTSIAIGLLIGLERQRNPTAKAGLRTCTLVAIFGTSAGLLADVVETPWLLAVGLLLAGATIIAAYAEDEHVESDSGTTTVIAVILCYCFGAMVWYKYTELAVALAIAVTILLHFKAELHDFSEKLASQDVTMVLQFSVLTFIVLPLLPDEGYGPYGALNPHHVWLMVVLISGLGLAGYVALRFVGMRKGLLVLGLLGGMVSSTATTLLYSRQAGRRPEFARTSAAIIALSNMMVPVRLAVLAAVTAPATLQVLLPALGFGIVCGLWPVFSQVRHATAHAELAAPEMSNPTSLRVALTFGALFAAVLVASAWLSVLAGDRGLYAVAAASGLVDVDAITLSSLQLFNTGAVDAQTAAIAVVFAFLTATLSKLVMMGGLGGAALLRRGALAVLTPVVATIIAIVLI